MLTVGESEVWKYLSTFGFNITKIPKSPTKQTPDFLVEDETAQYVIEVKDKENQKFIDLINIQNTSDKVDLDYDNAISGIIRKGIRQLDSYKNQGKIFKVLWFFIGTTLFGDTISTQIGKTLYGLQELEGYKNSGEYFQTLCFYFTASEFYRNTQLDAVIVQSPKEIVFCVNDFSVQRDELRQTRLYQSFIEKGLHIIEPSKSHCCVADDLSLDRRNSKVMAEYISKKYNLREITAYSVSFLNLPLE